MKKIIIGCCSALTLGLIAYAIMAPHSKASQSDYTFEYYYNNTNENSGITSEINSSNEYTEDEAEYDYNIIDSLGVDSLMSDYDLSEYGLQWNPSEKLKLIASNFDDITILVNKEYVLPANYVPEDLVAPDVFFSFSEYSDKRLLRQEAATALEKLFYAASEEGLTLAGVSGYRSYNRQFEIYAANLIKKGIEHTNRYSAMPGSSEHQTGLSIDVSTKSINYRLSTVFADTKEGQWLASNAHNYGYIIRFPDGKSHITGFSYEPWHIRYVGVELATYLYQNDLTLDEYYGYEYSEDIYDNVNYDKIIETYYSMLKPTATPTPSITQAPIVDSQEAVEEESDGDHENTEEEIKDPDSEEEEDNTADKDNNNGDSSSDKEPNKKPTEKPNKNPDKNPNKNPDKNEDKEDQESDQTTPEKDDVENNGDKDDDTEVEITPTPPVDSEDEVSNPEEPSITPTPTPTTTTTPTLTPTPTTTDGDSMSDGFVSDDKENNE